MTDWTHVGAHLPWLHGQALYIADESSATLVSEVLAGAGYAVVEALTGGGGTPGVLRGARQEAFRAIANALFLSPTAGANLDAFIDGMRELPERWPNAPRIALLWHGADALVSSDLLGWTMIANALMAASADAWSPRGGHPIVFETVAFVREGYGADSP